MKLALREVKSFMGTHAWIEAVLMIAALIVVGVIAWIRLSNW
jgi:hypothetical protein